MKNKVLKIIKKFYREHNFMPSIREVQLILNRKSPNCVYKIFKELERDGILNHNVSKKRWSLVNYENKLLNIKVLNDDCIISINDDGNNYYVYKIDNNGFKKKNIIKNDYLIIKKTKKLNNYDLGLFIINDNYRVMSYLYLDGFYMLDDGINKEILSKVKIIGKVIGLQRKKM